MRLYLVAALSVITSPLFAVESMTAQQVEQRIKPVGKVHVQQENSTVIQKKKPSTQETEVKEEAGQKTYERYCVVCHRDGLVGAPKFRDEKDWKSRLSGKTINDLVASALKGLNAMPMKGTCYECNEKDLQSAVEYMVPKS